MPTHETDLNDEYLLEFLRWFSTRLEPHELQSWWSVLQPYWVPGSEPGTGKLRGVPNEVTRDLQQEMLLARKQLLNEAPHPDYQ